jgi:hypothetical protein
MCKLTDVKKIIKRSISNGTLWLGMTLVGTTTLQSLTSRSATGLDFFQSNASGATDQDVVFNPDIYSASYITIFLTVRHSVRVGEGQALWKLASPALGLLTLNLPTNTKVSSNRESRTPRIEYQQFK